MIYPCLIPKWACSTKIICNIEPEGVTKYGEPKEPVIWEGYCNYQDKGKTVYTSDKKKIVLSGCALIPGDIAPEIPVISGGTITVNGEIRSIVQGTKARNPDNTVNYTMIEVG